ncbi:MAG TPA: DUF2585 family protein [Micropepsaceae bacterium]|nr:DUF2585 family protein [Micropepsaceae bacterium]
MSTGAGAKSAAANRVALYIGIGGAIIAFQALIVFLMGHPIICTCGHVSLWYPGQSGPETSQQLTDWYTFTHIEHGFLFYWLLWAVAPRMPFGTRLMIAMGIETTWEIVENTPFIINRYRQGALAEGYFGDSVINSVSDSLSALLGGLLARFLPVKLSAALVVATELFLAVMIRDNLALNIVQLVHPTEAISRWQTGG